MKIYVASKSSNKNFALEPQNVIEVCYSGPFPESDAKLYAKDHVADSGEPAYVFAVDIETVIGYKIHKEVVSFVTSKP